MTLKTSRELREGFLHFFEHHGHTRVSSSSLVPGNDPTLLFTNAGMVQFKDVFLGHDERAYTRATSSQRCVRAGGKHNDLDNVGYTARHHTFFEMLGNFSFGDYFKREAIQFAWDFLIGTLRLPKERLWITVYEEDQEAADIWLKEMSIDPTRLSRCGMKSNFWAMGDTGPCGPCSEIFYDHGPAIWGGPPGTPEEDGDRYMEIWNLVFMQYNRSTDGQLTPLPKPSVDTGMGLERLACVMQGVTNNFETDLFVPLIRAIADLAKEKDLQKTSLRVVADHIRSTAFLITDQVVPSNEGRGYVLRRILRRAIRHGHTLGLRDPFLHRLINPFVQLMGDAYPELRSAQTRIEDTLYREEELFARTLDQGLAIFEEHILQLKDKVIPGTIAFKLYDTYGFPYDLTADIARERGYSVDEPGFEAEMHHQRQQSKAASQFRSTQDTLLSLDGETRFSGYTQLTDDVEVTAIFIEGNSVQQATAGQMADVVLNTTPFYGESGGQVGDQGMLTNQEVSFAVTDTKKQAAVHIHQGQMITGTLAVGMTLHAAVDMQRRTAIRRNHSATHLLHAALQQILGDHVTQKGSLVAPDRLRFDFSHHEAISASTLASVEALVNDIICRNVSVETTLMSHEAALAAGAMALFGEKYGDSVRVLRMGDFSLELCGGTHVARTGDIGLMKITLEMGIAAGVRRIEAFTGPAAVAWVAEQEAYLQTLSEQLKVAPAQLSEKVTALFTKQRQLEKEIERLQQRLASTLQQDLLTQAITIGDISVLSVELPETDIKMLRETLDQLKVPLNNAVIVLGTVQADKVHLVAGVTDHLTDRLKARDIIAHLAPHIGGKGGGRADMAQAGGDQPEGLAAALSSVSAWVRDQLK